MSNLSEAISTSDRLKTLLALRDKIATTIDSTDSGRDIAALSKRLMEVIDEIDEINKSKRVKETPLSKRKAKRDA